jgi:ectoine hydroxylase-related dioxygenase (phytanoyl-CoA dioxygenase family)
MATTTVPDLTRYIDEYWERGFTVVEHIFTREEADAIAAVAQEHIAEVAKSSKRGYMLDAADDGTLLPRKLDSPYLRDERFRKFVLDDRLKTAVGAFIGARARLVTDQIFFKPPRFGSAKPYHQDNGYFFIKPDDLVITAWIALDDVDEENGCLRYIEGSHLGEVFEHKVIEGQPYNSVPDPKHIDLSKEVLAPVGKGGVVFHHSKTLHTSHRNESDRWRRGYATHWSTDGVTCDSTTLEKAYFLRDDYPDK